MRTTSTAAADPTGRGLTGFRIYTWWSMVLVTWLLLLIPVGQWQTTGPFPLWLDVVRWGATLAVAVVTVRLVQLLVSPRRDPEPSGSAHGWPVGGGSARGWSIGGLLAGGVASTSMLVAGDVLFFVLPTAVAVTLWCGFLPPRRRTVVLVVTALAGAVVAAIATTLTGGRPDGVVVGLVVGLVALVAAIVLASLWTWEVAARLEDARRMAAELAVADERLRFAADLHDIQGHSLQVIALKAELAARLVGQDPDAADAQLHEVQALAADALRDTRALVQGYRRTTLDAEIANATGVLTAAAVDGRMQLDPDLDTDALPDDQRHLLGLVVREAVTNVLRHSDARRADLVLRAEDGEVTLAIRNDGVPVPADAGDAASSGRLGGLDGLRERLEEVGGSLRWGRDGEAFSVLARVPVPASAARTPGRPTSGALTSRTEGRT